ncbi:hypothetical protein HGB25_03265 [Candidatus Saccharibacteria bacterium]|nr:hypothetical protein [Candidatus Saccharibacteria bacterium]
MSKTNALYPIDYTDEQLVAQIKQYQNDIVEDQKESPLSVVAPLITLGLNELQRRNTKKTHEATIELENAMKKLATLSSKQAKIAKEQNQTASMLTKVALVIAALSLLGTLAFSFLDYVGDNKWQDDQITQLKQVENAITESRP